MTCWPLPDFSRSSSATRMPSAQNRPAREVGDRNADPHRPLPRQAGDRHQSAHALRDLIEAGPVGIGPVLAETGNAGVDQIAG